MGKFKKLCESVYGNINKHDGAYEQYPALTTVYIDKNRDDFIDIIKIIKKTAGVYHGKIIKMYDNDENDIVLTVIKLKFPDYGAVYTFDNDINNLKIRA